ncbi:hypothetical protein L204_101430 [Cryptococcus depauperatus]
MSKHLSSPSSSFPNKRKKRYGHTVADLFPFQEIFLRILSFLEPEDLARAQRVSKYWERMVLDPQLWKTLYLDRYYHPHETLALCKDIPNIGQLRRRPSFRFPSRAFPPPSPTRSTSVSSTDNDRREKAKGKGKEATEDVGARRHDGVDWKKLLTLGSNWYHGNAQSQTSIPLPPSPSPSISSAYASRHLSVVQSSPQAQNLALFPAFIFTSSSSSPLVHCYPATPSTPVKTLGIIPPPPGWSNPSRPDCVTSICADENAALRENEGNGNDALPARLGVFYQSGGFVILTVRQSPSGGIIWTRDAIRPAITRPPSLRRRAYMPDRGDPVVLSVMCGRLLVVCTKAFYVSMYDLQPGQTPICVRTMHSDVSFHPASLSLLPAAPAKSTAETQVTEFQAYLTYSTPVYPRSWTVAIQEFNISFTPSFTQTPKVSRGEAYHVASSSCEQDRLVWPKTVRPVVSVKQIRGVGYDGRWCVLAGEDNKIEVFTSLPALRQPSHLSDGCSGPKVSHSQTLLTHSSYVTSLALADGRCVSGGSDGRVLVWELDDTSEFGKAEEGTGKLGKTVGYVEVRPGGRRSVWKGPSGPQHSEQHNEEAPHHQGLPHPQAISSAARSLFLPRPPLEQRSSRQKVKGGKEIKCMTFDEQKIAGVVTGSGEGELKVWNFD